MTVRLRIQTGGILALLLYSALVAGGQEASPRLRRVLVLPPPRPDAATQKWIAGEREAAKKPKRGGLFSIFASQKPAAKPDKTKTPAKKKSEKPEIAEEATPHQLRALCETLLYEDLTERLRTHLHLTVPTEAEVRTAAESLHLAEKDFPEPETLRRLAAALNCEAVLEPRQTALERREGTERALTLRGTVRFLSRASGEQDRTPVGRKGRTRPGPPAALPALFPFFGIASAGRVLFHDGYRRTPVQLAFEAAQQAAAVAAHTFWTGETGPFTTEGERVALLPIPAPTQADALLFTPEGRRVAPAAVRGLPADVTTRFQPYLAPLGGKDIVGAEAVRRMLASEKRNVEDLWRQDQPELARVQALGQRLDVGYVLMAHITEIELETGVPNAAQTLSTREARAEAVGALIRVRDGAVLWQDRATATMTLHPTGDSKSVSIDRQAVEDAEHFALSDLQRRFRAYRAHFEN